MNTVIDIYDLHLVLSGQVCVDVVHQGAGDIG